MFIKILLVSLLYAKVIGYKCGIVYNQEKAKINIINDKLLKGDWPWVVAIFDNGEKICTGIIISPKFVLTAAHCYNKRMLNREIKRHSFSIHAGTIYASEGEVVSVKKNKIRTFDETILEVARNDIAIFELERPLRFNHNVSSICLPKSFQEFPGNMAVVAGFGNILSGGYGNHIYEVSNNRLNHVMIPFKEFDYCDPANKEWNYTSSNYICAGSRMKGVATGDSGGPLMIKEPVLQQGSYKSRWIAVGVVVGGTHTIEKDRDFLLWSHSFFTRISYYCDWIEEITDGDVKCIEVFGNQFLTAKSTSTTIPSTISHEPCPKDWLYWPYTNKCYSYHSPQGFMSFYVASAFCQNLSATLTSVHNNADNSFIAARGLASFNYRYDWGASWLGLHDPNQNGQWQWMDGTKVNFTYWRSGYPDGKSFCAALINGDSFDAQGLENKWATFPCNTTSLSFWCSLDSLI